MQQPPELSIVVGASEGQRDPTSCLVALCAQSRGRVVEILFVGNAAHPATAVARRFARVTVIESDRVRLVPELWGLGVAQSRGEIVAITISGCVPGPDWVAGLLREHQRPDAAIGGAIEQAEPAGVVDWAVYFVRYASYMGPFVAAAVRDVPGDNGSYKRSSIATEMDEIARDGFWETSINATLRARGQTLRMDPALLVWHTHSYAVAEFSHQRFRHAHRFGRERGASMSRVQALVRAVAAPLSLATMVLRSSRQVLRRKRHRRMMLLALPLTTWFYGCWVVGEALGLVRSGD